MDSSFSNVRMPIITLVPPKVTGTYTHLGDNACITSENATNYVTHVLSLVKMPIIMRLTFCHRQLTVAHMGVTTRGL